MRKYILYTVFALIVVIIGTVVFIIRPHRGDPGDLFPQNGNIVPADIAPSGQKLSADGDSISKPQPPSVRPASLPPIPPAAIPTRNQGRLVLALTDAAVNLQDLDAIFLHITSLEIHAKTGWKIIPLSETRHDLLALDRAGAALAILADLGFDPGTYDQLRPNTEKITVQKDGLLHTAKLPSGKIIFNGNIVVEKEKTSAVILDVLADQSLVVTGSGIYIFLPVIHFTSYSNLSNQQRFERRADVTGGKPEHDMTLGMAPTGEVKQGFRIDNAAPIEFIGADTLRIFQRDEKATDYSVTAEEAVAIALKSRYIAAAKTITTGINDRAPVWIVTGPKPGVFSNVFISVYINAETGEILSLK